MYELSHRQTAEKQSDGRVTELLHAIILSLFYLIFVASCHDRLFVVCFCMPKIISQQVDSDSTTTSIMYRNLANIAKKEKQFAVDQMFIFGTF